MSKTSSKEAKQADKKANAVERDIHMYKCNITDFLHQVETRRKVDKKTFSSSNELKGIETTNRHIASLHIYKFGDVVNEIKQHLQYDDEDTKNGVKLFTKEHKTGYVYIEHENRFYGFLHSAAGFLPTIIVSLREMGLNDPYGDGCTMSK